MSKINKLGKSTFVIAILSFLLVAVLAFGGTYAYFSAVSQKDAKGTLNTAYLKLGDVTGVAADDVKEGVMQIDGVVQPNQNFAIPALKAQVTSNMKYYVRVRLEISLDAEAEGHEHKAGSEGYTEDAAGETIEAKDCKDYYENVLSAFTIGTTDEISEDVAMWHAGALAIVEQEDEDSTVQAGVQYFYLAAPQDATDNAETTGSVETKEHTITFTIRPNANLGNYNNTADGCTYWMEMPITISVTFEVLQAEYLNDGEPSTPATFAATAKLDEDGEEVTDETTGETVMLSIGEVAEAAWTKALTVAGDLNGDGVVDNGETAPEAA